MSLELLNSIYTISNANLTKEWLSVNESISPQNLNNFKISINQSTINIFNFQSRMSVHLIKTFHQPHKISESCL